MDRTRLLELALETLEKQRAEIDAAIDEIRGLQGGKRRGTVRKSAIPTLFSSGPAKVQNGGRAQGSKPEDGTAAGYLPARRAANIDPDAALRYES